MNNKTRGQLIIFILLFAQLACRSPLPGGSQHSGAIYTITSIPPFPTATATATASATPLPSPTATITGSPTPSRTPTGTATRPPTLPALPTLSASLTPKPNARPNLPVIARYLNSPPRLDGDWGDWKGLTDEYPANTVVWGRKKWTNAEDLSSSFRVGWDDDYLYLAMKVRDDLYIQNAHGAKLYDGDSLELLLDTRLKEDYDSAELSDDDFQLGISPGRPRIGAGQEAYLWTPSYLKGVKKNVVIEAIQESGMYRVEVAIPWSVFEITPVAGEHYGFAISVSDNDDGDGGVQQSMISNLPERYPRDPTTWGDLQLVK